MRIAGYRIRWKWLVATAPLGFLFMVGGDLTRLDLLKKPVGIALLTIPCAIWWIVGIARLALERPDGEPPPKSRPAKGQFY